MDITKHEYRIIIFSIIFAFVGIFLMIFSHIINTDNPQSIWAFLVLNIGGLFTIGGVYALISELFLKKHFAREIQSSIDTKLKEIEKDKSILNYGLTRIEPFFTKELLLNRIEISKEVSMLVMRNNQFFRYYCPELVKMINNNLKLTLLLFNPHSEALDILSVRFNERDSSSLKNNLLDNINNLIRKNIYLKLSEEKRGYLTLKLFDKHPTYSAYLFDDEELWLVPYFYRKEKRPVPIFIIENNKKIIQNEIYEDIQSVMQESQTVDLKDEFN